MPRSNGEFYPGNGGGIANRAYDMEWDYAGQGTYRAGDKPDIGRNGKHIPDTRGTSSPAPGPKQKKTFLSGIKLLMWKNFLLRKRHYIVTTFEILLPTLFTFMIVFFKTLTPPIPPVQNDVSYTANEFTEQLLLKQLKLSGRRRNATFVLGYAPQNEFTDLIMREFEMAIANNGKYKLPAKHVIKAFASEAEIKNYNSRQGLNTQSNSSSSGEKEILRAAIVFEEGFSPKSSGDSDPLHRNYGYKIRIVDKEYNTQEVYEDPEKRQPGPNTRNAAKGYQDGGFATLQVFLDKAITKVVSNHSLEYSVSVQGFPYPPYRTDLGFNKIFVKLLPFFMVFGFIFIVPSILRNTVAEKESGIKELMKIMSLESYMHWLGWLIDSILILIIPITVVVVLLFIEFNSRSGAFVVYSDPSVWWVVIFLYIVSAVCFLFFMSTFFQRATMAISVGVVLWILTYLILSSTLGSQYYWLNLPQKMASCLLPNMALHWAVTIMFSLESTGIGARWSYVGRPLTSLDDFTLGHVILMLLINIVLYTVLTLYFESILPSKYGISKPWNFIFKKSYWQSVFGSGARNEYQMDNIVSSNYKQQMPEGFETEPTESRCSVQISNLKKEFPGSIMREAKVAVNGLNLNMYHGQITVLLGCNGAGKTTTISILTGVTGPSEGTARINGFDIRKDMDTIRTQLGYCPQHNILFEKLTVEENLQFFGALKGMPKEALNEEVDYLLGKLDIKDKKRTLAGNISGGQKRKTCLGSALVGGSEFVIMDEPTAGMDPEARRGIWDLLLELRTQRTLLLTTHFMEEADILGDRIAIMAKGKIHCCGSPLFLKRHYGSGYSLIMSVYSPPRSKPDEIFRLVQKYCPDAYWKEKINELNESDIHDISIVLPRQDGVNDTSKFPDLFADITKLKDQLGIVDVGLPLTTLDDVFAKVDEETASYTPQDKGFGLHKLSDFEYRSGKDMFPVSKLSGFQLLAQHFWGLFLKRLIYTKRRYILFLVQLLLPFVLITLSVVMFNGLNAPVPPSPPLKIDLAPYRFPRVVYHTDNNTEDAGDYYRSTVAGIVSEDDIIKIDDDKPLDDALLEFGREDEHIYRERYIAAAEFKEDKLRAMFQTLPNHASPLAINLAGNAMLRYLTKSEDISISVTNHPMRSGLNSLLDECSQNPRGESLIPLIFVFIIPLGLSTLAASFIVFPLDERLCKAKQLQLMTGVNTLIFWLSSYLWDVLMMLGLAIAIMIMFPIVEDFSAFTTGGAAGTFFLIIMCYGIAAISFSYLFSLFMQTIPGGFALLVVVHILTGIIWGIVVHFLEQSNFFEQADTVRNMGRIFPTFGASISLIRFAYKLHKNVRCNMLTQEVKDIICNPNITEFDSVTGTDSVQVTLFRGCCDNCEDFKESSVTCFKLTDYIQWSGPVESEHVPADEILPGIGQELVVMLVMAAVYFIILLIVEYFKAEKGDFGSKSEGPNEKFPTIAGDDDVKEERRRVDELVARGETNKDAIVLKNISKRFGNFAAVSNVSFGVHKGECFGLLGVNGAGKTTLFKMITGNTKPTSGNSMIYPYSLLKNVKDYKTQIGYCPQYDGLIDCLSGRETIELFCRLRGYPETMAKTETTRLLKTLGLEASADVQSGQYSGGMKRRLSAGISMVGRPKVIMLDEPTSGVDPISRRQFWSLITAGREAGQALILTSHSMDECEALCNRLAIMVDGGLKCIGTNQRLKSKYCLGFTIMIKVRSTFSPQERQFKMRPLIEEIIGSFANCRLKEQHENVAEFQVANMKIDWHGVFKFLEDLKHRYEDVLEDYSVNETTLEEIFLNFAKTKSGKRKVGKKQSSSV